jgi:hypothetical protein
MRHQLAYFDNLKVQLVVGVIGLHCAISGTRVRDDHREWAEVGAIAAPAAATGSVTSRVPG